MIGPISRGVLGRPVKPGDDDWLKQVDTFVAAIKRDGRLEAAAKRKGIEAPASDNDLLVEIRDILAGRPLTHPSDPDSPSSNS